MTETLIIPGPDSIGVAAALAERLRGRGGTVAFPDAPGDDESIFAAIERADRVAFLVTPGWAAETWPTIGRYLANAMRSPAAFLAKLALIDLSEGAAVPGVLRPLLAGGIGIGSSRAPAARVLDEVAASLLPRRPEPAAGEPALCPVLVVGHPGSGKSTFGARLEARLVERDVHAVAMDPYPFLQALFRIDMLRRDTARFASDALSEFVIKDARVLGESVMLTKARLSRETAAGRPVIVELAFSDGPEMADIGSAWPGGLVVHVAASLDACRRNNEARGEILRRRLSETASPSLAFDRTSSVHYVPPALYERYDGDPRRWEEGAARLAALAGARYHRLDNEGHDLPGYLSACDAFIDGTVLPLLDRHRGGR